MPRNRPHKTNRRVAVHPRGRLDNRLWAHRKKMGYTQRAVARLLGHGTATHVSDYERGVRQPTLRTALKLEIVLCAPLGFLFAGLRRRLRREVEDARNQIEREVSRDNFYE